MRSLWINGRWHGHIHQKKISGTEFTNKNSLWGNSLGAFLKGWATFLIPDNTKYILEKVT